MGSAERRGRSKNYLTVVAGDPAAGDLFDGVDTTWNRVPGRRAISAMRLASFRASIQAERSLCLLPAPR